MSILGVLYGDGNTSILHLQSHDILFIFYIFPLQEEGICVTSFYPAPGGCRVSPPCTHPMAVAPVPGVWAQLPILGVETWCTGTLLQFGVATPLTGQRRGSQIKSD